MEKIRVKVHYNRIACSPSFVCVLTFKIIRTGGREECLLPLSPFIPNMQTRIAGAFLVLYPWQSRTGHHATIQAVT